MAGQVQPQAFIGVLGNAPRLYAVRQSRLHAGLGDIGDQLITFVQARKLMQQIADIDFVARQVTADGVRVNRKSHQRLSIAACRFTTLSSIQTPQSRKVLRWPQLLVLWKTGVATQ